MSAITIGVPAPLRSYTQGVDEVLVEAGTIGEALTALEERHGGVLPRILADNGEARTFVDIYLGNQNIRALRGLQTPVADGNVVSIITAVAGGEWERGAGDQHDCQRTSIK